MLKPTHVIFIIFSQLDHLSGLRLHRQRVIHVSLTLPLVVASPHLFVGDKLHLHRSEVHEVLWP